MPTYRSITISITSQFDICQLPEYAPPTSIDDPFSTVPTLLDPELSLVSVYLPTYPSSQFWLRYSIAPPYPPKAIYYFKLFLNKKCVVSWGCGEDDGYRGKTVFGLYDSGGRWDGESTVERRMLCFSGSENPDDVMEIKVYRAKGRQRVEPELLDYKDVMPTKQVDTPRSRSLVKAGYLTREHPKRFYNYALIDPLDKPFACFRYFPRTWDQLVALGVASPTPSTHSSPLIHPTKKPPRKSSNLTISSIQSNSSSSSSSINTREETLFGTAKAITLSPPSHAVFRPSLPRPASAQGSSPQKPVEPAKAASRRATAHRAVTAPALISLSPPHNTTATQPRFASFIRRGMRTPSPQKQSIRERVPTPSPPKDSPQRDLSLLPPPPPTPNFTDGSSESSKPRMQRSGSMGLLMNAVNSALNRKARAVSTGASEGNPVGETLVLEAMQSDSDDQLEIEGEDDVPAEITTLEPPRVEIPEPQIEKEIESVDAEKERIESPAASAQPSKSESESDTSSKRVAKERKGFLKFNLLRKKVEAESTPDAEREALGDGDARDSASKRWRSWGKKSGPSQGVEEQRVKGLIDTM
ncbi:hypothetical protein G7Y79_00004g013390 [Physcia stellaris]|nr:hypothetical protein G7Y79_00004g013390 [Physcia stellaris]